MKLSQKEKNNVYLTHIYGIWKNGTDEPICKTNRDADIENGHVNMGREATIR